MPVSIARPLAGGCRWTIWPPGRSQLRWPPIALRVLFVAAASFRLVGVGLYLALWLAMPQQHSARQAPGLEAASRTGLRTPEQTAALVGRRSRTRAGRAGPGPDLAGPGTVGGHPLLLGNSGELHGGRTGQPDHRVRARLPARTAMTPSAVAPYQRGISGLAVWLVRRRSDTGASGAADNAASTA